MENYFTQLNAINVSDHVEKKKDLKYLSWAWAWQEVKKLFPTANYKIYEREDGCIYWTDGRTAWVKTGVTVNDIEHIEYLPIMDVYNKSIPVDRITSFDVNKSIQRSLTKACARHGLGLYIYAGEDLPEEDNDKAEEFEKDATAQKRAFNKAVKSGENKLPEETKSLDERAETCLAWLDKNDKETYRTAANTRKDRCHDVRDACLSSGIPELVDLGNKIAFKLKELEPQLNDSIPF